MNKKKQINSEPHYPLFIAEMGFRQIENYLNCIPSIIVPLGGLETYGESGALGCATICSHFICRELSSRLKVVCAPDINYSCTGSFKAFAGCASLHYNTFINFLLDMCNGWFFQGFKRILLINSISDNSKHVEIAARRFNQSKKEDCVKCFDWQMNKNIQTFISKYTTRSEFGRSQKSVLSMISFLKPELLIEIKGEKKYRLPDQQVYKRWEKRGKDPQKFRKIFPSGSTSEDLLNYDSSFGEELFGYILKILEQQYSSFLKINPENTSNAS